MVFQKTKFVSELGVWVCCNFISGFGVWVYYGLYVCIYNFQLLVYCLTSESDTVTAKHWQTVVTVH